MTRQFAHLHTHTEYSMLDGAAKVRALLNKAVALGQPAVASTDHGNVFSHYEMWKTAKEMREKEGADITFIAGCELYVAPASRLHKAPVFWGSRGNTGSKGDSDMKDVSGAGAYTHMTMLATNGPGLNALFELTSRASIEGAYAKVGSAKPRIDAELLAEVLDNWPGAQLVGTTGCPSGAVQTRLRLGQWDKALEEAAIWRDILGEGNYFVELMDHGNDFEAASRPQLMELAKAMNLPLLATNDSHYVEPTQSKMHDALLCLQMGKKLSDTDRMKFDGSGYHLRSAKEMRDLFKELPDACDNTLEIADRVAVDAYDEVLEYKDDLLPEFPVPEGHTPETYLREQVMIGLKQKYPDPEGPEGITQEAWDRVPGYELPLIQKMGYSSYMLMVWDFIKWARERGIRVGPGRGSAAGSGTSYALDITTVPTLEHGLLFERFINPERVSPPDVDVDFEKRRRDEVFRYLAEKWGEDKVCRIQTLGTIKAKAAIKDACRVLGKPYGLGEKMTKAFPKAISGFEAGLSCVDDETDKRYADAQEFRDLLAKEDGAQEVFNLAKELEGLIRSTGVHACGFVVASKPLMGRIPLVWSEKDRQMVSGFPNAEVLEPMGYLKVDALGLDTMDVITLAVDMIRERHGVDVNDLLDKLDDPAAYRELASGHTVGMFQVASSGLSKLLSLMKADRFEDISAALALYRPGPMGAEAHTTYALRKVGKERTRPIHPELEDALAPILGNTYGLCVTGDTLIWDADSGRRVRIDSVRDRVRAGTLRTIGVDGGGRPVSRRVTNWVATGTKPALEILAASGQRLRLSSDHPVLTMRGWIQAGDLVPGGDRIARPSTPLPLTSARRLSVSEARFLGYLTGDGHCTLRVNSFFNKEKVLLDHVVELAGEIFPDSHPSFPVRSPENRHVPRVDFMAHPQGIGRGRGARKGSNGSVYDDLSLNRWLKDLGFTEETRSASWFVPSQVFESDQDVICHYLAALWDCDGHVSGQLTFLKTISSELAQGVADLLSRLGIQNKLAAYESYESRNGTQTAYSVHVYDPSFWDLVVPLMAHPEKQTVPRAASTKSPRSRGVNYPLLKERMRLVLAKDETARPSLRLRAARGEVSESAIRSHFNRVHGKNLASTNNADRNVVRGYAPMNDLSVAYLGAYGQEEDWFYANQHWTLVESVTPGAPEPMYDITVEEVHNFLANGFIAHNCVYQEQIMAAAQEVAGYTLGAADLLRKAIGKKKPEVLAREYEPFSSGMRGRGFSEEAIKALWDILVPFSSYSFNLAHTVSYGHITYATAYLKAHYPAEFMAALLTMAGDDKKKLALYLGETRRMGLKVYVPDVNEASPNFSPTDDGVRFGLNAVSGLGPKAVDGIIEAREERPFRSFADFLDRIPDTTCTKGAVKALIRGGGFDSLGHSRRALDACYEDGVGAYRGDKKKKAEGQFDLFSATPEVDFQAVIIPDLPEWDDEEKLAYERKALGTWVSGHPLTRLAAVLAGNRTITLAQLATDEPSEGTFQISGQIVDIQTKTAKASGNPYAIIGLEDLTGRTELRVMGRSYGEHRHLLTDDRRVTVKVYLKTDMKQRPGGEEYEETSVLVATIDDLDMDKTAEERDVREPKDLVLITVDPANVTRDLVYELKGVLQDYPGNRPVWIKLTRESGPELFNLPGFNVADSVALRSELKGIRGLSGVRF